MSSGGQFAVSPDSELIEERTGRPTASLKDYGKRRRTGDKPTISKWRGPSRRAISANFAVEMEPVVTACRCGQLTATGKRNGDVFEDIPVLAWNEFDLTLTAGGALLPRHIVPPSKYERYESGWDLALIEQAKSFTFWRAILFPAAQVIELWPERSVSFLEFAYSNTNRDLADLETFLKELIAANGGTIGQAFAWKSTKAAKRPEVRTQVISTLKSIQGERDAGRPRGQKTRRPS